MEIIFLNAVSCIVVGLFAFTGVGCAIGYMMFLANLVNDKLNGLWYSETYEEEE